MNAPDFFHARRLRQELERQGGRLEPVTYERSADAGRVSAWHLTPASDARGLLVFAHGAGNDGLFPQIELFKAVLTAGFAVFSFDLDGHGVRSTTMLSAEALGTLIPDAIGAARRLQPTLPLHLAGFSFGGSLSLHAVAVNDAVAKAVRSLTLVAAPHLLHLTPLGLLREALCAVSPDFYRQIPAYGLWGILPAAGAFKRRSFPIRFDASKSGTDYTRLIRDLIAGLRLLELAPKVQVPSLLVYGSHDRIAPLAHGRDLQRILPQGRLLTLPGATHYTTMLSHRTAAAVADFLSRVV